MTKSQFVSYVHDFYGPDSDLYPMGATLEQIDEATQVLIDRGDDVAFDSFDREKVRDILIDYFGLTFPRPEPVEIDLMSQRERLEAAMSKASKALMSFPRNRLGLVPDGVRVSLGYREAKRRYETAFTNLREFNAAKRKRRK